MEQNPSPWRVWHQIALCAKYNLPNPSTCKYSCLYAIDPDKWNFELTPEEMAKTEIADGLNIETIPFTIIRTELWTKQGLFLRSWLEWEKCG